MLKIQSPIKHKSKKGALAVGMKVGFFTIYGLLGWTVVLPLVGAKLVNDAVFGKRVTPLDITLTYDDFKDVMTRKEMSFMSGKNKLAGYHYTAKPIEGREQKRGKALVIVSHGIGCNMDGYLNRTEWFVKHGYEVFTFDMTGTCLSEGKGLRSLMQSKVDLHNAIEFVKTRKEFEGLPILVYGHSWSGYAVANMLNFGHPELTAVASLSGFNDTWGILRPHAARYVGSLAVMLKPWFKLLERIMYGKTASGNGVTGINAFGGPVLVAHSVDDPTVPIESSVYVHRDEIVNPNAEYMLYQDRGHTLSRPIAAEACINEDYAKNRKEAAFGKCDRENELRESDAGGEDSAVASAVDATAKNGGKSDSNKGMNIFQRNVNEHYQFSKKEVVFATDEEFMTMVDNFFERALERRAKAQEGDNA